MKPGAQPDPSEQAENWLQAGKLCFERDDLARAESAYRKALALRPHHAETLANLGLTLHFLRRSAEAHTTLLECLRLKPDYPEALNALGLGYRETGQSER